MPFFSKKKDEQSQQPLDQTHPAANMSYEPKPVPVDSTGPLPPDYINDRHGIHDQGAVPPHSGAAPQNSFPMNNMNGPGPGPGFGGHPHGPQGTPIASLGPHPAPINCPNCHHSGITAVEYSSGGFTHALGALVCFVTCLGCIPYFFTSLKDATHKCAKCGIPLATYHRSGRTEVHLSG
ncbi:hypothetical protein ACHAQF_003979 [Verticillium nonalfalfae]